MADKDPRFAAAVSALRRRAGWAVFTTQCSWLLAGALVIAGAVILVLRSVWDLQGPAVLWPLGLLALAPLIAYMRTRPRLMRRETAAAWLDVRSGGSGLVVTEDELGENPWRERLAQVIDHARALPRVRLAPALTRLGVGSAFCLVALQVPIPRAKIGPPVALYQRTVEELTEKLETLTEEVRFDEQEADELAERLEALRQEIETVDDPESTFEALARLEEDLEREAQRVSQESHAIAEDLAQANSPDEEQAREAFEESLSALIEEGLDQGLPKTMEERIEELMGNPEALEGLSLDELQALAGALQDALSDKLGELVDAELLDPSELLTPEELAQLGELAELGSLGPLGPPCECEECAAGGT